MLSQSSAVPRTLERERTIRKNKRGDLAWQTCGIEIGLVHGLSTSSPSAERDTQARSLPVGSVGGIQLAQPRAGRVLASELQTQAHCLYAGAALQQFTQHIGAQAIGALGEFARLLASG